MLTAILWLVLGWRAGFIEILAEVAIGVSILGGGGGRRLRINVLYLVKQALAGLRAPAPERV
jgi:hypothetical protein